MKIAVRASFEAAHRLMLMGTCENIHGHSWKVFLELEGTPKFGVILDFREVKSALREHLEENYDHRFLMGPSDYLSSIMSGGLPGANKLDVAPTTENIARLIGTWAQARWPEHKVRLVLQETENNLAEWP